MKTRVKRLAAGLTASARKEFRLRAGLAAVADYEREHGAFTSAELADADRWAAEALGRVPACAGGLRRRGFATPKCSAPESLP